MRSSLALGLLLAALAGCASPPPPTADTATPAARTVACALCGAPIEGPAVEWRRQGYHPACYDRVGPVCGVCRTVIHGRHVVLGRELAYHETCLESSPRCEGCGLPTEGERGGALRWDDGRITCRTCRLDAAVDSSDARQACLAARSSLRQLLGLDLGSIDTPVTLVSKPELLARAGALAHPALKALTECDEQIPGDGTRGERHYRIYVLSGLPRAGLVGVLSHELFHVLQSEATAHGSEPPLREGAANYVQVRVLRARGEELRARLLEEDRDPVYGDGLRRIERLAGEKGESAAIQAGLRAARFPEGY
jgi:hypothetical protein